MSENVLIAGKWRLNFNEFITQESMRDAMRTAQTMDAKEILGLLLLYSSATHHVDLTLLKELQRMTDQEQQLTNAVTAVVTEFDAFTDAVKAELTALSSTVGPTTDPVVTTAIGNLNTLATNMKSATADALAAIPPVTTTTPPVTTPTSSAPTSSTAPTDPISTNSPSTPVVTPTSTTPTSSTAPADPIASTTTTPTTGS